MTQADEQSQLLQAKKGGIVITRRSRLCRAAIIPSDVMQFQGRLGFVKISRSGASFPWRLQQEQSHCFDLHFLSHEDNFKFRKPNSRGEQCFRLECIGTVVTFGESNIATDIRSKTRFSLSIASVELVLCQPPPSILRPRHKPRLFLHQPPHCPQSTFC